MPSMASAPLRVRAYTHACNRAGLSGRIGILYNSQTAEPVITRNQSMRFVEYIKWTVTHLGAWLLMLLCAAGMGNLFLRKCRFRTLTERLVFTVAAGLG